MPAAKMAGRPDGSSTAFAFGSPANEQPEQCPVCKQSTYLNPNMKFKINPECYHRMCDSCIERIFASGPAPCPVAGCKKTLRRKQFRVQTFGDLAIERECDIRRRVNGIFNKREEDFETLRAFNDYQETKEEMTWKLIDGDDAAAVEKQLSQYKKMHEEEIQANLDRESYEREEVRLMEEQREQRAAAGRADLKRELADERAARDQQAKGVVDSIMGASGDAEEAARRARQRVPQYKNTTGKPDRTAAQVMEDAQRQEGGAFGTMAESREKGTISFAGQRKIVKQEPQGPYDPFDGLKLTAKHYTFKVKGDYRNNHIEAARKDRAMLAGGSNVNDYCRRALFEAHSGLGVMIGKEKAQAAT